MREQPVLHERGILEMLLIQDQSVDFCTIRQMELERVFQGKSMA